MTQFSNNELIKYLSFTKYLFSNELINSFYEVDRADFVLEELIDDAYFDMPLSIGYNQTISQPKVVALMLEMLDLKKGQDVLDLGSGSGYTTALISRIIGSEGFVFGLEIIPELVNLGQGNIKKYNIKNARIIEASHTLGMEDKLFDRILVSAAADDLPYELIMQLRVGGKLVIPIKDSIYLIEKKEDGLVHNECRGFSFVPLVYKK